MTTIKAISLLLIPSVVVLVSACAGPAGPGYAYGPGPAPRDGYYWNGSVYVEGRGPYDHDNGYDHRDRDVNVERTNVNEVNVDRTNVNDRTVNRTNVNDRTVNRTNVNNRTVNRTNANESKRKTGHNAVEKNQNERKGNQPGGQAMGPQ